MYDLFAIIYRDMFVGKNPNLSQGPQLDNGILSAIYYFLLYRASELILSFKNFKFLLSNNLTF
uniref:Photosystem I subunit VII n=1 Tax=Torilis scabra TaxID=79188 RepID=A0A650DR96_9APIA|nr:photosystem I subunit VII [Torilis scabra]